MRMFLMKYYIWNDYSGYKIYPKNTRRQNCSKIQKENSRITEKIDSVLTHVHGQGYGNGV